MSWTFFERVWQIVVLVIWALLSTVPATAQSPGPVFPRAFVVEHGLVQTDPDGSVFATDPVTDTYGGSWIVSQRADGSRVIIDFLRREITEVRPAETRYSVLGFDRMAQLLRELAAWEGGGGDVSKAADVREEVRLRVVEVEAATAAKTGPGRPADRPGVRHLRVLGEGPDGDGGEVLLDAWFDPEIRLGARALAALDHFEMEILGAGARTILAPRALAAARREAAGALPVLTRRPMVAGADNAGSIEDVAYRVETIDAVPLDIVTVPEGFRRTPHPLELMVAHAKREAELNALMGGGGRPE